jgi:hypothetical protein
LEQLGAHFSDIDLSLKQVDPSIVGEVERYVLNATLGAYGFTDEEREQTTSELGGLFGDVAVEFDPTTARRFAGDRTLPRTRYHVLLDDRSDSDDLALLREISAYVGSYAGLVSLFDTTGLNTLEWLGVITDVSPANYRALDLNQPSLLIAVRPLARDEVLSERYGSSGHYVVQFPFRFSTRSLQNVTDLRRPTAQNWLAERFNGEVQIGDRRFPVLLGREATDLSRLLPTLLDQWLGAGWTTANLAGLFLRQAGAAGVVYPSARSNAFVDVRDGALVASSGWCFVSYEGARGMHISSAVSVADDDWPSTVGFAPAAGSWVEEFIPIRGAQVQHHASGSRAGSIRVKGVAEYNTAIYRLHQVTAVLQAVDANAGGDVASRLAYMALYSASEDIAELAWIIRAALLGDYRAIAVLKRRRSAAGSDYEAETLAGVQELVACVPEGFHATGDLARAWNISSRDR